MCTLTVSRDQHSICITMNRDERRDRTETGLQSEIKSGSIIYYPEDKASGGTWIGVNDRGVTLCLMNRYDCPADPVRESRGKIIPTALSHGDVLAVMNWFSEHFDYSRYNPFTLLLVTKELIFRIDWTGESLIKREVAKSDAFMATSSSVETQEVIRYRQQHFLEWQKNQRDYWSGIPAFHFQQDKNDTSSSVFMARVTTHTKSITQVKLSESGAQISYLDNQKLKSYHQSFLQGSELSSSAAIENIEFKSMQLKTA